MKYLIPALCILITCTPMIALGSNYGFVKTPYSTNQSGRQVKASFEETWTRYPSPDVILANLRTSFPAVGIDRQHSIDSGCRVLNENNRNILGDNNPVTGEPLLNKPNTAFVVWYSGCLTTYFKVEFLVLSASEDDQILRQFYGSEIIDFCRRKDSLYGDASRHTKYCSWSSIDRELRLKRVQDLVIELIGPDDVVQDLGLGDGTIDLARTVMTEIDAQMAAPDDRYAFIGVDSTSLNTLHALQIAKFLILMTDMMKY